MVQKTRRERFEEIAGSRVQMVLEKLENLSKCANKRNYEFSKEDVDKMFKAINAELKSVQNQFESELNIGNKEKKKFEF